MGLHDEEVKKTNVSEPLTAAHRREGRFCYLMTTVHPYQYDPNYKHSRMTWRACVNLQLDVYGIEASINTQILKTSYDIIVHLEALDNGINTDIDILNKEKGDTFSECCTEISKAKFLRYVNEVLFEMVKTALNNTYLGGKIPQNYKTSSLHAQKCMTTKRIRLWLIIW